MTDDPKNKPAPLPPWMREMAEAVPYHGMADRAAFSIATSGPTRMIPRNETSSAVPAERPDTGGWQHEIPLTPPAGVALIDAMCVNADRAERQQGAQPDAMQQMMQVAAKVMEMQTQTLQILVQQLQDKKP